MFSNFFCKNIVAFGSDSGLYVQPDAVACNVVVFSRFWLDIIDCEEIL